MIGSNSQASTRGVAVNEYVYVIRDSHGPVSTWRIDAAHRPKKGGEFTLSTAASRGRWNETYFVLSAIPPSERRPTHTLVAPFAASVWPSSR